VPFIGLWQHCERQGSTRSARHASCTCWRGTAKSSSERRPEWRLPVSIEVEDTVFAPAPLSEAVPLTEWRALFHDSPLAIAYVSRDLRLLRVNGPFAVLCGRMAGEVLGRHCYEVFGERATEDAPAPQSRPCSFCRVRETLRTGDVQEFERPFGQAILRVVASPVGERRGEVTGAVLMIADVTAERQLREQVVAAQRLASVGVMTSGVAHELRNPLTSVLGFAQLLRQRADLPEGTRGQLERIWSEARRCDHIVNSLLKFTRRRGDTKALVDVNRVVLDSLDLLRYPIEASRVRVNQCLHAEPLRVVGHFCELQQVVQNIVNNALDALREATRSAERGVRSPDPPHLPQRRLGRHGVRKRWPAAVRAPQALPALLHHKGGGARDWAGPEREPRHRARPRGTHRGGEP